MLECFEVVNAPANNNELSVELAYEQRQKSRAKATMNNGDDVAWFLPRGRVLADGDFLLASSGEIIKIVAADECVSETRSADQLLLMRAAYHLGNRHVPLQIGFTKSNGDSMGAGFLRYQHDHVLDDMVRGLGLVVNVEQKPFHPEPGAYHTEGHSEGGHSHNSHSHSHDGHHHHNDNHE